MNEMNTYNTSPNIRLINPISKNSQSMAKIHNQWAVYLGREEQGPNAKINYLS